MGQNNFNKFVIKTLTICLHKHSKTRKFKKGSSEILKSGLREREREREGVQPEQSHFRGSTPEGTRRGQPNIRMKRGLKRGRLSRNPQ